MTFEDAWQQVALAGRELGSGPATAAARLVDDGVVEWLTHRQVRHNNAQAIRLGIAVGLVMAEHDGTLQELNAIHDEWRSGHGA